MAEGACEVGTVYYSDTYGYEDSIDILETVDNSLTGDIIYPIALLDNADKTAEDIYDFLCSDRAKEVYEKYMFIVEQE